MVDATELVTEEYIMVLLRKRQPKAVMNLISALAYYGMTTQIPDYLSIALPRGIRAPLVYAMPMRVWFTQSELLEQGVADVAGKLGRFYITTPERTLVDCFKYRHKLGLDIFMEALRMANGRLNPSKIHLHATRLRVIRQILPFLKFYYS